MTPVFNRWRPCRLTITLGGAPWTHRLAGGFFSPTTRPTARGYTSDGRAHAHAYVKDAFHRYIIHGEPCINPLEVGTKAGLHYRFDAIPPGSSVVIRLRLREGAGARPALGTGR